MPLNVTDASGADYVAAGDEGTRPVTLDTKGTASVLVTTQTDNSNEPDGPVTVEADTGPRSSRYYWVGDPSSAAVTVTDDGNVPATVAPSPTRSGLRQRNQAARDSRPGLHECARRFSKRSLRALATSALFCWPCIGPQVDSLYLGLARFRIGTGRTTHENHP